MIASPHTITLPAPALRTTEAEFQKTVIETAELLGWVCIHIRNTVANPDALPDLLLFRDDRYVLAELKRVGKDPTPKQRAWHEAAAYRGVTVHVWRPTDEDWYRLVDVLNGGRFRIEL